MDQGMHRTFKIPYIKPVLTGLDLAREAAEDFEDFFLAESRFPVRVEVGTTRPWPVTRGKGAKTRIIIPSWMADEVIRSSEQLFFHLFIICHEIAHVVHFHNDGPEQDDEEYSALEMWADFYGAKIMMCLITFGAQISSTFREFFWNSGFEKPLEAMGLAAGQLVERVYVEDPLYPWPLLRVGLLTNGIQSFFRREIKQPPNIWPYSVFRRMFASWQVRRLMKRHPEHLDIDLAPVEKAREWHLRMQGEAIAIRPWLKPRFVHHLHTSFQQTDDERQESINLRTRELKAMGFLKDLEE